MSEVKRYEMKTTYRSHESWDSLEEDKDGGYVNYEDYAALESKCAALAAENAWLKQRTQQLIDIISNTDNDYCMCGSAMKDHVHGGCGYPTGMFDYYYNQWLESDNKTPATDAILAEVRAQGVDSAINTVIAMMNHQHPVTSKAIDIMRVHAYQIRKGVQS